MRQSKKAVALVSLILIIIVLLMITGIVSYVSYDTIEEAKKTTFAKDITSISDAANEYYAVNGSFPTLEDGIEITANEFESKAMELYGNSGYKSLSEELEKNKDNESKFYEIDINKIGIKDAKYGLKSTALDIYIISSDNNIIYYYGGYELSDNVYFSNVNMIEKGK